MARAYFHFLLAGADGRARLPDALVAALDEQPGIDVRARDHERPRRILVAVLAAGADEAHAALTRALGGQPGVTAELEVGHVVAISAGSWTYRREPCGAGKRAA